MAARKNWEADTRKRAAERREKFSKLFQRWFLERQAASGQRQTLEDLAQRMNKPGATVRMWWNGLRVPTGDSVHLLADPELVGPQVYEWLDMPMPDPRLLSIIAKWRRVPERTRDKLAALVESVTAE